jgi:hypothetical protein
MIVLKLTLCSSCINVLYIRTNAINLLLKAGLLVLSATGFSIQVSHKPQMNLS